MKRTVFTSIRAVVGIGLALLLIHLTLKGSHTDIYSLWNDQIKQAFLPLLGLAFCFHGISLAIGAWRWQLLMRAQNIDLGYITTLRLALIGFFFNLAVPGAVGGDVVKMGYTMRQVPAHKTAAVFSIAVDRLMGILGLFIVAGVAVLLNWPAVARLGEENVYLQAGAVLVALGSFAGVLGFLALEYHAKLVQHKKLQPIWGFLRRKLPDAITSTVLNLIKALDLYKRSKKCLAKALLLAVCIHCALALNLFVIGQALHEDKLSIGEYFVTTQMANAIASVPITPGGLGLRDKGAQQLFQAFGMVDHKSGAIPVTLTLILLAWALIGGAVFTIAPVSPALAEDQSRIKHS